VTLRHVDGAPDVRNLKIVEGPSRAAVWGRDLPRPKPDDPNDLGAEALVGVPPASDGREALEPG